jgi:hypothetical protein
VFLQGWAFFQSAPMLGLCQPKPSPQIRQSAVCGREGHIFHGNWVLNGRKRKFETEKGTKDADQ